MAAQGKPRTTELFDRFRLNSSYWRIIAWTRTTHPFGGCTLQALLETGLVNRPLACSTSRPTRLSKICADKPAIQKESQIAAGLERRNEHGKTMPINFWGIWKNYIKRAQHWNTLCCSTFRKAALLPASP